jgi:hypothetical protein
MFSSRAFPGALGAFLLGAAPVAAQHIQTSIDLGAVALRYADSINATAATLTPDLRIERDRGNAQISGTFSQFTEGGWSAQAATSGSLFTPARRGFLGELAAIAGGSTHKDGTRTGQAIANVRLHLMNAAWGVFTGAGGGGTWDGVTWRRLLLGDLGAWIQNSAGTALFTITPVSVDDSVNYVDGQLTLSRSFKRVDLTALAGGRSGGQNPGVDTRARSWGSVTAVAWIRPRVAVTASGGTYPVDPTQGFPGGRFISAGIRLANSQRRPVVLRDLDSAAVIDPAAVSTPVSGFQFSRESSGSVSMRVVAPGARTVEISGDFTGWTPMTLQSAGDGSWTTRVPLAPGKYEMNIRIDGGAWIVPPGLLPLKDEFGGSVGLLVLE